MANAIKVTTVAEAAFTITLASLADGAGRSSASVSNSSEYPSAKVSVEMTTGGTAPDDGSVFTVYLLLDMGTIATDGWGGTDAAFTPQNAKILGTISVTDDTATEFSDVFDTLPVCPGGLPATWGIAIYNETGQAISSTEADSFAYYNYQEPEIQ